jgi:hypothetical protein
VPATGRPRALPPSAAGRCKYQLCAFAAGAAPPEPPSHPEPVEELQLVHAAPLAEEPRVKPEQVALDRSFIESPGVQETARNALAQGIPLLQHADRVFKILPRADGLLDLEPCDKEELDAILRQVSKKREEEAARLQVKGLFDQAQPGVLRHVADLKRAMLRLGESPFEGKDISAKEEESTVDGESIRNLPYLSGPSGLTRGAIAAMVHSVAWMLEGPLAAAPSVGAEAVPARWTGSSSAPAPEDTPTPPHDVAHWGDPVAAARRAVHERALSWASLITEWRDKLGEAIPALALSETERQMLLGTTAVHALPPEKLRRVQFPTDMKPLESGDALLHHSLVVPLPDSEDMLVLQPPPEQASFDPLNMNLASSLPKFIRSCNVGRILSSRAVVTDLFAAAIKAARSAASAAHSHHVALKGVDSSLWGKDGLLAEMEMYRTKNDSQINKLRSSQESVINQLRSLRDSIKPDGAPPMNPAEPYPYGFPGPASGLVHTLSMDHGSMMMVNPTQLSLADFGPPQWNAGAYRDPHAQFPRQTIVDLSSSSVGSGPSGDGSLRRSFALSGAPAATAAGKVANIPARDESLTLPLGQLAPLVWRRAARGGSLNAWQRAVLEMSMTGPFSAHGVRFYRLKSPLIASVEGDEVEDRIRDDLVLEQAREDLQPDQRITGVNDPFSEAAAAADPTIARLRARREELLGRARKQDSASHDEASLSASITCILEQERDDLAAGTQIHQVAGLPPPVNAPRADASDCIVFRRLFVLRLLGAEHALLLGRWVPLGLPKRALESRFADNAPEIVDFIWPLYLLACSTVSRSLAANATKLQAQVEAGTLEDVVVDASGEEVNAKRAKTQAEIDERVKTMEITTVNASRLSQMGRRQQLGLPVDPRAQSALDLPIDPEFPSAPECGPTEEIRVLLGYDEVLCGAKSVEVDASGPRSTGGVLHPAPKPPTLIRSLFSNQVVSALQRSGILPLPLTRAEEYTMESAGLVDQDWLRNASWDDILGRAPDVEDQGKTWVLTEAEPSMKVRVRLYEKSVVPGRGRSWAMSKGGWTPGDLLPCLGATIVQPSWEEMDLHFQSVEGGSHVVDSLGLGEGVMGWDWGARVASVTAAVAARKTEADVAGAMEQASQSAVNGLIAYDRSRRAAALGVSDVAAGVLPLTAYHSKIHTMVQEGHTSPEALMAATLGPVLLESTAPATEGEEPPVPHQLDGRYLSQSQLCGLKIRVRILASNSRSPEDIQEPKHLFAAPSRPVCAARPSGASPEIPMHLKEFIKDAGAVRKALLSGAVDRAKTELASLLHSATSSFSSSAVAQQLSEAAGSLEASLGSDALRSFGKRLSDTLERAQHARREAVERVLTVHQGSARFHDEDDEEENAVAANREEDDEEEAEEDEEETVQYSSTGRPIRRRAAQVKYALSDSESGGEPEEEPEAFEEDEPRGGLVDDVVDDEDEDDGEGEDDDDPYPAAASLKRSRPHGGENGGKRVKLTGVHPEGAIRISLGRGLSHDESKIAVRQSGEFKVRLHFPRGGGDEPSA